MGTLVYDADCGFCTRSATWLAGRGTVRVDPWQGRDLAALGLTEEDVSSRAYWVDGETVVAGGAEAISHALTARGGLWGPSGRLLRTRLVAPVAARSYRTIARHRHRLPGGDGSCRL